MKGHAGAAERAHGARREKTGEGTCTAAQASCRAPFSCTGAGCLASTAAARSFQVAPSPAFSVDLENLQGGYVAHSTSDAISARLPP